MSHLTGLRGLIVSISQDSSPLPQGMSHLTGLRGLIVGLGLIWVSTANPAQANPTLCLNQLAPKLEAIANQPKLQRARWGILVQTQASEASPALTLYAHEANRYFIPASSVKLLTTAAALNRLGPTFQVQTLLTLVPSSNQQKIVKIVGQGDPSFGDQQLHVIAQTLKAQGLKQIDLLIGEDAAFHNSIINPNWEWGDIADGGLLVNSLIVDQNDVQALPLNNAVPGQLFLNKLRQVLTAQGIAVLRSQISQQTSDVGVTLVSIDSPPLAQLLVETNQESNNLYAEVLLRWLGVQAANSQPEVPAQTTYGKGLAAVKMTLTQLGIDSSSYILDDGSGLSRHNLVSPAALVQTLQVMGQSPYAEIYKNSLAVAGVNGTLKNRFQETPVQNRLWAKTGTLSGTVALVGYLHPTHYQPLVFSFLINQASEPASVLREAIDQMVLALANLSSCTSPTQ